MWWDTELDRNWKQRFFFNSTTIEAIERGTKLVLARIDGILAGIKKGGRTRPNTVESLFIVDRGAERKADLIQSVMMLCEGDAVEADKIMRSPISLYEAKLKYFAEIHKKEGDKKQTPPRKMKP